MKIETKIIRQILVTTKFKYAKDKNVQLIVKI